MTTRAILLGATALSLFAAAPAMAEEALQQSGTEQPASTQASPPAPPAPAATTAAPQTVVVTGSRIRRNAFNTTSPIAVITNENAVLAGQVDATEILQGSVAAAGSLQINNFFTGFVVEGGPGIQTLGLNSLGPTRTLLLINGRRLPPSGTRGQVAAVDLQTLPNLVINRYEILKEGASPIYGSDAVGGVVNAITRTNVDGWEVTFNGVAPFESGGEEINVGVLWGKTEDRWNVMVSGEFFKEYGLRYSDRDECSADYVFNAATGARADFIDPTTGQPRCFGLGVSFNRLAPAGLSQATGQGTWIADARETARRVGTNPQTGATNVLLAVPGYRRIFSPPAGVLGEPIANQVDYVHPLQSATHLLSPSERINLYASGAIDLDILGGVEVFGEAIYANRKSSQTRSAQFFFSNINQSLVINNIFNPFNSGTTRIFAQPVVIRPANNQQEVTTWQVVGGVRGQTGSGFFGGFLANGNWELYAQTSSGEGEYQGTTVVRDRIEASLQTVRNADGSLSCPTPVFTGGACLPINFFDPRFVRGDYTAAEYDYLYGSDGQNVGRTVYEQTVVEFNISGDVFEIPGASDAVRANFGIHYRVNSINDVPGRITLQNCVAGNGPTDLCRPLAANEQPGYVGADKVVRNLVSNQFLTSTAGITRGEDTVVELYTEWVLPLVANRPFIEDLELTAAYRYTDYESYDANATYKFTLNWQITPEFRVIGITGTSYRAPALFELFLGDQTSFPSQTQIDPCVNWGLSTNLTLRARCAAEGIPDTYTGGNAFGSQSAVLSVRGGRGRLKEEESNSTIYSFVWTPTWADLSFRIDAWRIEVTDQVTQLGGANIVGACYADSNQARADRFCPLVNRDRNPTSNRFLQIISVSDEYLNISATNVEGIDLTIRYAYDFSFGRLAIESENRWTTLNETALFQDQPPLPNQGEIGSPVYTSNTTFSFAREDWTYAWSVRAIGKTNNSDFNGGVNPVAAPPGSYYNYNGVNSVLYKTAAEATITHTLTVRYRSDDWTLLAAIDNVFDEAPPSVSTGVYFARLGTTPLANYDIVGRSAVVQVVRRF